MAELGIVDTVKTMLGVADTDDAFDGELIVHINTAFMSLMQLGVGPEGGFIVLEGDELWGAFLETSETLEGSKSYIFLKVRQMFDPPSSSFVLESISRLITELEWRLKSQVEDEALIESEAADEE